MEAVVDEAADVLSWAKHGKTVPMTNATDTRTSHPDNVGRIPHTTPRHCEVRRSGTHPSVSERSLQTSQLHLQMSSLSTWFEHSLPGTVPILSQHWILAKGLPILAFLRPLCDGLETTANP